MTSSPASWQLRDSRDQQTRDAGGCAADSDDVTNGFGTGQTVTPLMSMLRLLTLGCALLVNNAAGFYLPGAAPHDYEPGEKVDLFVNALTPMLANEAHAKLVRVQSLLFSLNGADFSSEIAYQLFVLAINGASGSLIVLPTDDYYNPAFHFCQPEGGPRAQPERLGSILFGDRIFNSPFDVSLLLPSSDDFVDVYIADVCQDQNA